MTKNFSYPIETLLASNNALFAYAPPDLQGMDNLIDFSFGNPSPDAFPTQEIVEAANASIISSNLEYSLNEGSDHIRSAVATYIRQNRGIGISKDALIITNGAMEAVSLVAHAFLDKGDVVFVEEPTYYRASHILRSYGAELYPIRVENDGIDIDRLVNGIRSLATLGKKPKMIYTIPNYQNPTGTILSLDKRKTLLELSYRYGFLILEDDVYSEFSYEGSIPPSLYALGESNQVIQTGSLSKVICPGISIGWLMCPTNIVKHISHLKVDGGTNPLSCAITSYLLNKIDWNKRLAYLRQFYRPRWASMINALSCIPSDFISWVRPSGGFFIWVQVCGAVDYSRLLEQASLLQIRFLRGHHCIADGKSDNNSLRLAFSLLEPNILEEGIRRLDTAIRRSHIKY